MIYTADFLIERRRTLWEEKKSIEEDARYKEAAAKKILEDESLRKEIIFHPEKLIELEFVIVNKKKAGRSFFPQRGAAGFYCKTERCNSGI